jgi:DNA-directed RNA polymerase sigma subunit (sigma70/sigma32)
MIREDRGISQTELGRKIGVTFQQVQKYENGKNRLCSSLTRPSTSSPTSMPSATLSRTRSTSSPRSGHITIARCNVRQIEAKVISKTLGTSRPERRWPPKLSASHR